MAVNVRGFMNRREPTVRAAEAVPRLFTTLPFQDPRGKRRAAPRSMKLVLAVGHVCR